MCDANCTKENLLICKLFSLFRTNPIRKFTDVTTVINCIEDILRKGKVPSDCLEILSEYLNTILVEKSAIWAKRGVCYTQLSKILVHYYEQLPVSQFKVDLFTLFCKISTLNHINR